MLLGYLTVTCKLFLDSSVNAPISGAFAIPTLMTKSDACLVVVQCAVRASAWVILKRSSKASEPVFKGGYCASECPLLKSTDRAEKRIQTGMVSQVSAREMGQGIRTA